MSFHSPSDRDYLLIPSRSKAQWMARILFLESVAGVPGMVGGMCRHLSSLRLMKRDGGWINTLLQEAENERMHLVRRSTFLDVEIGTDGFADDVPRDQAAEQVLPLYGSRCPGYVFLPSPRPT